MRLGERESAPGGCFERPLEIRSKIAHNTGSPTTDRGIAVKDLEQTSTGGGRLAALSAFAQRVLMVERAWPPLVFALAVAILFLAASWAGAWQFAPRSVRIGGVILFALGAGAALSPLVRLRRPAPRDALARLDRDSAASHRPASSLADTLANDHGDPATEALWAAHRARLERAVDSIRVAPPSPRMAERDPYALRFAVAMLAFAAAVVAGPEMYGRLASAFDWRGEAAQAAAAARIDAWIDPPPYAGRPPVVIGLKTADPQALTVPEDSVLVVRGDPGVVATRVEGGIAPSEQNPGASGEAAAKAPAPDAQAPKAQASNAPAEKRWTIRGAGKATILRGGTPAASVVIAVIPAGKPTIALTEDPRANLSGTLTLAYRTADHFGLAGARATFARAHEGAGPPPRTLSPPPEAALELPASENGAGDARTTIDLSEHPWAGAKVTMTLRATSISGKTGESAPVELTLPQRVFHNPLARALVEQRRNLILDPDHAPKPVGTALGALTIAPELFDTPANAYLGLKQAKSSLEDAHGDADLLDVAAMLWAMAQQIENGDFEPGRARPARRRAGAARSASARRERPGNQEADGANARGRQALHERDGEERPARRQRGRPEPSGAGSRQAARPDGGNRPHRDARRRPGDARPDAGDVREHAQRPRRPGKPGRTRNAQADRRTREAPARSAGVARRYVPQ